MNPVATIINPEDKTIPSIIETIQSRQSWRTYTNKPAEQEKREKLLSASGVKTFFGTKIKFVLVDTRDAQKEEVKHLGTYGVILGAKLFLAAAAKREGKYLEDLGYAMESVILEATALGLGTCWMGVTFDRAGFSGKMNLQDGEALLAVTPVGYAKEKRRLKDLAMRKMVGSDNRLGFEKLFYDGDFHTPLKKENAGKFAEALKCVRFGPSASNKQPWRVVMQTRNPKSETQNPKTDFHFFLEYTKGYQYPFGQKIDMGIAMRHFELACEELGLKGGWVVSKPELDAGEREYVASWIVD
jgi:nitroreductase